MKRSIAVIAGLSVCLASILTSCLEELENVDKIGGAEVEPSVDFPLVNSEFTMSEFISEGKSRAKITEQGGLMVLTYTDTLSTPSGDTFFTIPDQQSPVLSIDGSEFAFPSPGATVTFTKQLTFPFTPAQAEAIDSVWLKGGNMVFQMSSTFPSNVEATFTITSMRKQGATVKQDFAFAAPGNQTSPIDLEGATLDLTDNGTTANTITCEVTLVITDNGQPLNNTHRIDCDFALQGLNFRAIFGDLASRAYPLPADSIVVDLFGNAFGGNVSLLSPSIRLSMRNSFGLPIAFDIQSFIGRKPGETLALSGGAVTAPQNPYLLGAPSYAAIGESVTTDITINSGNSNLTDLISFLPKVIDYQLGVTLNPAPATGKSFALDTSKLSIGVHLELPFHGQISGFVLSKQYDFGGLGIEDISQSKIRMQTVNESPMDMDVQVFFVDEGGAVLDSLFTDTYILEGAPVDADGFAQEATEVTMDVSLNQAKIDRLEQAELLVIRATASSTNSGTVPVKFSATDKLKISLGLNTRIKYNLN